MELILHRKWPTDKATVGELLIGGEFECYTIEDVVRDPGVKVPGQTAIPAGRYRVILSFSHRFQKVLPQLLDVPMFDGIRIHCGNKAADTEGCILVGRTRNTDWIGESRLAMDALMPKLESAKEVWITIVNA